MKISIFLALFLTTHFLLSQNIDSTQTYDNQKINQQSTQKTIFFNKQDDQYSVDSIFLNTKPEEIEYRYKRTPNPGKAAMLSAVIPGLGQAYNGDYWKIPIIYGVAIFFIQEINLQNDLYHQFRTAEIALKDKRNETINPFNEYAPGRYSDSNISNNRQNLKRQRDYLVILGSICYLLNIVEAHTSAHLKEFDTSTNFKLKFTPTMQTSGISGDSFGGISLVINFR